MQRNRRLRFVRLPYCLIPLMLAACAPSPTPTLALPTKTAVLPTQTMAAPKPTQRLPTPTPQGRTLLVTSTADSGSGTLRLALQDAQNGDTITFDPSVFPPDAPVTIFIISDLPPITQGNLTIDASNAGVILDGSDAAGDWLAGLQIVSSNANTIRGMQISNFSGPGIAISGDAQYNTIGGERTIGSGLFGQGNLLINNDVGVVLSTNGTSLNTITGNLIGTDTEGAESLGNNTGVWIAEGANRNTVGSDNIIAHNRGTGIQVNDATQNLIFDNVISGNEGSGMVLCCVLDGRNTVTGNIIGLGPGGNALGNGDAGIVIIRTSHNVVGPGNTIAHNLGDGVVFWEDAPQNTVTQNSIHDNGGMAFSMSQTGVSPPSSPLVLDFNLRAGTIAGMTCPGCAVEIFSDEADEAAVYEGSTTADEAGVFSFDKVGPFAGPRLTATAIDENGTTSQLALHTTEEHQSAVLQEGNAWPRSLIQIKPFDELVGNHIGDVFDGVSLRRYPLPCTPPEEDWTFAHVVEMGFTWVRLSVDRLEWWENGDTSSARSMGEYSSTDFNACQDGIISALAENHVTILHTIVYWDEAVHSERIPDYRNEAEVQGYLDYARLLVRHFKDRIQYYGILNEAALFVDVQTYLDLIRRTIPVIREEDPEAKIVVGGTANLGDPGSRWYLQQILESDVMPLIDAIELHPMYGASPGSDEVGLYYRDYPDIIADIKKLAVEHGFDGELLAAELSWSTEENPDPASPRRFSVPQVAKYYARAVVQSRALDMWAALGGPYWMPPVAKAVTNLTTILDGAEPEPLPVEIESRVTNIISYTFSFPNGERLVAIWTNDAAVDYDPGASADLTFPGLTATQVIGIDPLISIEQELELQSVNGNLVINALVVRDYPIFVRLVP